ncbi:MULTISPECIES: 2-hydroxyacid dehydrogenase [Roseovarius]|uniref:D-isomer specific 2-hydroxyacid dehydrogenase family protein n=2 Tax=Roseovarius nubinhibens TaxID=314263 RepID=A3SRB3_ROSNI|nr:D-glycerate dehydrogenase [Roseovarius nubinhibens]EAP75136.1 D-isomer specific 2-hydroxyacid dehydrogenase family protein [Roseovarius nubinhibens ISM]MBU2998696.1 D-glycerate dehydrogenase [Roseovarius nubinhibens]HAR52806.1 D-glycerate dehydrogenase [Roseovarius nubinhibens]
MTRVLITRRLPDTVLQEAEKHFEIELRDEAAPLKLGQMRGALALYDGILPTLGDLFSAEAFAEAENPRCKILANFGVGYNHIDAEAARAVGIAVTNTPGAVTDATADVAMTLMLMSARRAGEGERLVRSGRWTGWQPTQMLGLHLSGKTVGILGMGRIGQAIARRCHFGFGMDVLYANRSVKELDFPAEKLSPLALAARADVVVIAMPGGSETHHFVGTEFLRAMQGHAHLVNIARGNIVDEAALIRVLDEGGIAGAGLDVYEHEPEVPEALRAMENVVLLPHLGTAALEVREAMGYMAVENLRAFFAGEAPPNLVN